MEDNTPEVNLEAIKDSSLERETSATSSLAKKITPEEAKSFSSVMILPTLLTNSRIHGSTSLRPKRESNYTRPGYGRRIFSEYDETHYDQAACEYIRIKRAY